MAKYSNCDIIYKVTPYICIHLLLIKRNIYKCQWCCDMCAFVVFVLWILKEYSVNGWPGSNARLIFLNYELGIDWIDKYFSQNIKIARRMNVNKAVNKKLSHDKDFNAIIFNVFGHP